MSGDIGSKFKRADECLWNRPRHDEPVDALVHGVTDTASSASAYTVALAGLADSAADSPVALAVTARPVGLVCPVGLVVRVALAGLVCPVSLRGLLARPAPASR